MEPRIIITLAFICLYLDLRLTRLGELVKFNNRIEEGVNSPIREMLRNHRGLSELSRIKAVFWWCYMHTEAPLEPVEMLRSIPRNKDLQTLINAFRPHRGESIYPDTYGNAVVWSELQQAFPIPIQQNDLYTHFLSYNSILLRTCANDHQEIYR